MLRGIGKDFAIVQDELNQNARLVQPFGHLVAVWPFGLGADRAWPMHISRERTNNSSPLATCGTLALTQRVQSSLTMVLPHHHQTPGDSAAIQDATGGS